MAQWKPALGCSLRGWEGDRRIFRIKTVRQQCSLRVTKVAVVTGVQWYYFCFPLCRHWGYGTLNLTKDYGKDRSQRQALAKKFLPAGCQ